MATSTGMNKHDNEEGWQEPSARDTSKARAMTIGQSWCQKEDSNEGSVTSKTPLQGSIKTQSNYNSFEPLMEFNTENEDYEEINNDEVDLYTFKVKSLDNSSQQHIVEELFTSSRMKTVKKYHCNRPP
jgi:hypothetical protein